MSYIAEFRIASPLVQEPLKEVPEMVLHNEDVHMTREGEVMRIFWASGGDFNTFESALLTDSTVKDYTCLTEVDDQRLYRITHFGERSQELLYPKATEYDIGYLDVTVTHEGSHFRVRAPTMEALQDLRETCQENGIPFQLERLYKEEPDDPTEQFGLTPAQHEVLVQAHKRGYFEQPRNITLEELAEEFEVSSSALGRRMRRAFDNLVEQTLRSETEGAANQS